MATTAIGLGLLIGCLLCFTNLYFGLQTGWISMMSLQSALIGFLLAKLFKLPLSSYDNVLLQTTATATGTMPLAAGFVGIVPALAILDPVQDGISPVKLSWFQGVGWSLAVALFGVFLSPPLRKQVIVKEKLAFPSGTATAQLISVLHNKPLENKVEVLRRRRRVRSIDEGAWDEEESRPLNPSPSVSSQTDIVSPRKNWHILLWSFAASSLLTLLAYFFPVIFSIPLFGSYLADDWLWTFSPSLSYVGQGIIMGFPTTLSMALGMIIGWALLSPISRSQGWAPGPVSDMRSGARGWILWPALAIMCADCVISLLPVVAEVLRKGLHSASDKSVADEEESETATRLVPLRWVAWGTISSILAGTLLVWLVFGSEGIKPWATLVGYVLGGLLSILGVRALGETDINPVSGLGKVSQLVFAVVSPGNVVANVIAGGVAEAGAQQAGDLMQDLKTGHLVGASPRLLFLGQMIGSLLSIFVTTTAYTLYTHAYPIPGPTFPAPTAYVWLSLARLLRDGSLPQRSGLFMLGFAALFTLSTAIKTFAVRRHLVWHQWVPSGVAFAIGFLNTPSFTMGRLIGGVIELWWRNRANHNSEDISMVILASGFVLGEGVLSIITLILRTCGVGVISCIGCSPGSCGVC